MPCNGCHLPSVDQAMQGIAPCRGLCHARSRHVPFDCRASFITVSSMPWIARCLGYDSASWRRAALLAACGGLGGVSQVAAARCGSSWAHQQHAGACSNCATIFGPFVGLCHGSHGLSAWAGTDTSCFMDLSPCSWQCPSHNVHIARITAWQ